VSLADRLPLLLPVALPGISGLLLIGLIVLVSFAMARSAKRLQCARLRDELVDAARLGELDVSDARVFWLIDWFDRVAATGRVITSGRHATERPCSTSLTESLTHALTVDGRRAEVGPSWPAGAQWPTGPSWQSDLFGESGGRDIQTRAIRYQKRKLGQRHDVPKHGGLDVIGHAKPAGALMPFTGPIPLAPLITLVSPGRSASTGLAPSLEPSLGLPGEASPLPRRPVPAMLPVRSAASRLVPGSVVPGSAGSASAGLGRAGSGPAVSGPVVSGPRTTPSALSASFTSSTPSRSNRSEPVGRLLPTGVPGPSPAPDTSPQELEPAITPRSARRPRAVVAPRTALAPRHAGRTIKDAERDAERTSRELERELGRAGHNALKEQIFAVATQDKP
jgi:hypothetical protein